MALELAATSRSHTARSLMRIPCEMAALFAHSCHIWRAKLCKSVKLAEEVCDSRTKRGGVLKKVLLLRFAVLLTSLSPNPLKIVRFALKMSREVVTDVGRNFSPQNVSFCFIVLFVVGLSPQRNNPSVFSPSNSAPRACVPLNTLGYLNRKRNYCLSGLFMMIAYSVATMELSILFSIWS